MMRWEQRGCPVKTPRCFWDDIEKFLWTNGSLATGVDALGGVALALVHAVAIGRGGCVAGIVGVTAIDCVCVFGIAE